MVEQLGSLLLPIDALLAHHDFHSHDSPPLELINLFRSMWFLCVLFNFTNMDEKHEHAMEWLKPALGRIACKTPSMVIEESYELVASDVEFNSVIRQEYASCVSFSLMRPFQLRIIHSKVLHDHRDVLAKHMSLRPTDLRHLSSGQIVFVLVIHDLEIMRSSAGMTSSLPSYFINDGLNKHPDLSNCMDSVAEKVGQPF